MIGGNRIGNALIDVEGHGGVDQGDDGNLKLESLVDDRRLTLGVDDEDAIGRLGGAEDELLVARAELLGAEAIGEEAAGAPERVGGGAVGAHLLGHEVEDFVEERVGVDEHEAAVVAGEGGHEVAGTAHANEGLVGVDDGHFVAEAIGELLQMVSGNTSTHLSIGAKQLLYHHRMDRHLLSSLPLPAPLGFLDPLLSLSLFSQKLKIKYDYVKCHKEQLFTYSTKLNMIITSHVGLIGF